MSDKQLFRIFSTKDSSNILRALSVVQNLIDSNEFKETDASLLYPCFIPLLVHTHYKIRKIAFQQVDFLLDKYSDYIIDSFQAIPNCLSSLVCKDNEIVKHSSHCLEVLFDLEDPKYWWDECEKIILKSKSMQQRVILLDILHDHYDEIPIRTIIALLRDPLIQVQRPAYDILQMVNPEIVQNELEACKKFLGYQFDTDEFIEVLKLHRNASQARLKHIRAKKAKDPERERRRQMAEKVWKEEEAIRSRSGSETASNNDENDFLVILKRIQNRNGVDISDDSPLQKAHAMWAKRDSSSPAFKLTKDRNSSFANLPIGKSAPGSPGDFRNNIGLGCLSSSQAHFSPATQKQIAGLQKLSSNTNLSSNTSPQGKFLMPNSTSTSPSASPASKVAGRPPLPHKTDNDSAFNRLYPTQQNFSSILDNDHTLDSLLEEFGSDDDSADMTKSPNRTSMKNLGNLENQTLGQLPELSKEPIPFQLVDLSPYTWDYRKQCLEDLYDLLCEEKNYEYRPDYLLDCIMSAAKPFHQKVAPILANVIAEIILANPEYIGPFLTEIVNFLMSSQMMFPQKDTTVFDRLIEALFLEVHPPDLIMAILEFQNRAAAHAEILIKALYLQKPIIKLSRHEMDHLVAFLFFEARPLAVKLAGMSPAIAQPSFLEAIDFLFSQLSANQPKLFATVVYMMPHDAEVFLTQYVKEGEEIIYNSLSILDGDSKSRTNSALSSPSSPRSPRSGRTSPMLTIIRELKKGDSSNIPLLAECFDSISISNPKHRFQLFLKLLNFFSKLSRKSLYQKADLLRCICFSHFTSIKLIRVLSLKKLDSPYIIGFSRFVYFCPKYLLVDAPKYYDNLYELFKRGGGPERDAIAVIIDAIQKVSGKSILECCNSIAPAHQNTIQRIINQCQTDEEEEDN